MAEQNKQASDAEAARKAAEKADAAVARRGQEIAAQARAAVNQPMRPPMQLEEACQMAVDAGEDVIIVAVPRNYMLLMDFPRQSVDAQNNVIEPGHYLGPYWGSRLAIAEGAQQMPKSIAEHWWSKQNGVKLYVPPKIKASEPSYSKAEMDAAIAKAREEWDRSAKK